MLPAERTAWAVAVQGGVWPSPLIPGHFHHPKRKPRTHGAVTPPLPLVPGHHGSSLSLCGFARSDISQKWTRVAHVWTLSHICSQVHPCEVGQSFTRPESEHPFRQPVRAGVPSAPPSYLDTPQTHSEQVWVEPLLGALGGTYLGVTPSGPSFHWWFSVVTVPVWRHFLGC